MKRKDNWEALYAEWHGTLTRYVKGKRGRAAKLARHLGVSRQTVHRWCHYQKIPGWAVLAIHTTVRLGSDKLPEPIPANEPALSDWGVTQGTISPHVNTAHGQSTSP